MTASPAGSTTGQTVPAQAGPPSGDDDLVRGGLVRNVRVGRQAIHDARRTPVAYELQFRAWDGVGEDTVAGERATSQVIASTFGTFGLDAIADGRPVFINFTRAFLTGVVPIPVEATNVVIEVFDDVEADDELIEGLRHLAQAGYQVALDDFHGDADRVGLLELADYVKVDVTANLPDVVPGLIQQIRDAGAVPVASSVEDAETFDRCVQQGFELFQGPHLQRPLVLERRTLSPSQLICVRLLNDLADPETPIARIEQMVGMDPGLTLRLLRAANSSAVGASREVTSLRQALVIIGPKKLRSWVVLTLLEGATATAASDGLWNVLARAYSCQKLGAEESDLAFTIGLLSGAAQLLGVEPDAIADGAGVGPDARDALLEGAGAAGRALIAVLAHERDDDEGIASTGLLPFDVSRAYLESLSESLKLVHDLNIR
jgi:EAL and modified HD-GYP domain-containing signal transduction protein